MIAAIVALSILAALLLIHAIRIIVVDERARRNAQLALDEALAAKYRTGMTQRQLDELAAERWD